MRIRLDREIEKLKKKLFEMGNAVEESIRLVIRSIKEGDISISKDVKANDSYINNLEVSVDKTCLKIFALKQPIAIDLRFVASSLKVNSDLERIGDYAVKIAEDFSFLKEKKASNHSDLFEDIYGMGDLAISMLRASIEAFMQKNVVLANRIIEEDDKLDALYEKFLSNVFTVYKDGEDLEESLAYVNIAKSLERIGDRAKNICENAIYLVEGKMVKHKEDQARNYDV